MKCFGVTLVLCLTLIFGCSEKQTANNLNSVPEIDELSKVHVVPSESGINNNQDEVDLDGNGTKDKISFVCQSGGSEFILTVNDISIKGTGDNLDGHFKIVDIDNKDNIKEIAIPESGSK